MTQEACAAARRALSLRADGALDAEAMAVLGQHLAACELCRAEATLQEIVVASLRQIPRPEPPGEIRRQLLAQIRAEAETAPFGRRIEQVETRQEQGRWRFVSRQRHDARAISFPENEDRHRWAARTILQRERTCCRMRAGTTIFVRIQTG